jgi:hypothetical protein
MKVAQAVHCLEYVNAYGGSRRTNVEPSFNSEAANQRGRLRLLPSFSVQVGCP